MDESEHRPYRKRYGRIQRCLKCGTPWPCAKTPPVDLLSLLRESIEAARRSSR